MKKWIYAIPSPIGPPYPGRNKWNFSELVQTDDSQHIDSREIDRVPFWNRFRIVGTSLEQMTQTVAHVKIET